MAKGDTITDYGLRRMGGVEVKVSALGVSEVG